MSKKTPKPIEYPLEVPITPRLLAAAEAAIGRKIPPGARVMIVAPAVIEKFTLPVHRDEDGRLYGNHPTRGRIYEPQKPQKVKFTPFPPSSDG